MRKLPIALGLVRGLAIPMTAQAAMSCSPSGEACASVTGDRAGAVLGLDSFAPVEDVKICIRRAAERRAASF